MPKYVPKLKKSPTKPDHKWCVRCNVEKPINDFKPNKRLKSGLSSWCIGCSSKYNRDAITKKYEADPHFKWKAKERQSLNQALRKSGLLAPSFQEEFEETVGCDIGEFKAYIEAKFEPGMTWANYGRGPGKWSIEYVKSLDRSIIGEMVNCFTNLRPVWSS